MRRPLSPGEGILLGMVLGGIMWLALIGVVAWSVTQ